MKRRSGYQLMRARDPRSVNDRDDWEQARLIAFRMVEGVWPSESVLRETNCRLPDPPDWNRGEPKPESWDMLDRVDKEALRLLCRTDRERMEEAFLELLMREDAQINRLDWTEEYGRIIGIIPKHFRPMVARAYDEQKPLDRTTAGIIARAMFSSILTDELPGPRWAKAVLDAMLI